MPELRPSRAACARGSYEIDDSDSEKMCTPSFAMRTEPNRVRFMQIVTNAG